MGMVLLADAGEQLEAGAAVAVPVLHADLGEDARHDLGPDAPVDRSDRTVAAGGGEDPRVVLAAAPGQQAGARQLLDAEGQAHVGLAGLDGHERHPQGGRTRGARVGHVVDGDPGLAELLLQLLADAGAGGHEAAGGDHPHVGHGHPAVGQSTEDGLGGQVHHVLVRVLAEFGHVDPEDPQVVRCHRHPSLGSNPNPIASVPSSSVPTTSVVSRTCIPSETCSGSGWDVDQVRPDTRPPAVDHGRHEGRRDARGGERHDGEGTHLALGGDVHRGEVGPPAGGARVAPVEVPGTAGGALVRHQVRAVAEHQVVHQRDLLRHLPSSGRRRVPTP